LPKIEIGKRRLDVVEFAAIAKALKIDPRTLFAIAKTWVVKPAAGAGVRAQAKRI
jgi:hypothetical protein